MSDKKKINVNAFFTQKQLEKLYNITKKAKDVDSAYDAIEKVLKGTDFKSFDCGTNRYVWRHKKYKKYIFKIAGDSHGISANYREFYNGDIDKRLTFSYSISNNGVVVVQEAVERMTSKKMNKHRKDIVKMLKKLSNKVLLVDCKISNFKNFGIRKDGEVCLLDHGDVVPFETYQDSSVSFDEEMNVSLRCRRAEKLTKDRKRVKQCKGKLKYNSEFSMLVCNECGSSHHVHEAYEQFYSDKFKKKKNISLYSLDSDGNEDVEFIMSMDEIIQKQNESIQKYCIDKMKDINIESEEQQMPKNKLKFDNIQEIDGYKIPMMVKNFPGSGIKLNALMMGRITPKDYLKFLGQKPSDWLIENNIEEENEEEYDEVIEDEDDCNESIPEPKPVETKAEIVSPRTVVEEENDIQIPKKVRYDNLDIPTPDELETDEDDEDNSLELRDDDDLYDDLDDEYLDIEETIDVIVEYLNDEDNVIEQGKNPGFVSFAISDIVDYDDDVDPEIDLSELHNALLESNIFDGAVVDFKTSTFEVKLKEGYEKETDSSDIMSDADLKKCINSFGNTMPEPFNFIELLFGDNLKDNTNNDLYYSAGTVYELVTEFNALENQNSISQNIKDALRRCYRIVQNQTWTDLYWVETNGDGVTVEFAKSKFLENLQKMHKKFESEILSGNISKSEIDNLLDRLNVTDEYDTNDDTDDETENIKDALDEFINAVGVERFTEAILNNDAILKEIPKSLNLIHLANGKYIPVRFNELKGKHLLVAWTEDGEDTAVKLDLYNLINKKLVDIEKHKVTTVRDIDLVTE